MKRTPKKAMSSPRRDATTTPRRPPRTPATGRTPLKEETPTKEEAMEKSSVAGEENVLVAIRMRPLNTKEDKGNSIWRVIPKHMVVAQTTTDGKPLAEREKVWGRNMFQFDKTFDGSASTKEVYGAAAKDIVKSTINGLNGTVFAYGQTSSGKTFTMQGSGSIAEGSVDEQGGIVHLAVADIFKHIRETTDREFWVRASFLEIYNEEVRDLLAADTKTLQIREDPRRGVFVEAEEEFVTDFDSLLALLAKGEKSRQFAATAMNERSSRSHTIFRITIESRETNNAGEITEGIDEEEDGVEESKGAMRVSTLNLVDLAGSESVRLTGAIGKRQKEGGMINQSLLALSQVIAALGDQTQSHVNFRDSKLTRILQPSLSGNARLAIVCCATPSDLYLEETRSTLLFATRAKLVKTRAQVNVVHDDRSLIRQLRKELAEARRYGGGPGGEVVRELEHKAALAGTEAKKQEDIVRRLKASILSGKTTFQSVLATPSANADLNRKRRISICDSQLATRLVIDSHQVHPILPSTLPRMKKNKAEEPHQLLPSRELDLLRNALSVKNICVTDLQTSLQEALSTLAQREDEIVRLTNLNQLLHVENDEARSESVRLVELNNKLNDELQQETASHGMYVAEKQAEADGFVSKINDLTGENSALSSKSIEIEQKCQKLAAELESSSSASQAQLKQFEAEKESLLQEIADYQSTQKDLVAVKESLEGQVAAMQDNVNELETQRAELLTNTAALAVNISDLEKSVSEAAQQLDIVAADRDAVAQSLDSSKAQLMLEQERVATLELELATRQGQHEDAKASFQRQNDSDRTKIVELEDSVVRMQSLVNDHVVSIGSMMKEITDAEAQKKLQLDNLAELEAKLLQLQQENHGFRERIKLVQTNAEQSMYAWNTYKVEADRKVTSLQDTNRLLAEENTRNLDSVRTQYEESQQQLVLTQELLAAEQERLTQLTNAFESYKASAELEMNNQLERTNEKDAGIAALTIRLDELSVVFDETKYQLIEAQKQLVLTEDSMEEKASELVLHQNEIARLTTEVESFATNLQEAITAKAALESELQETISNRQACQHQLSVITLERDKLSQTTTMQQELISALEEKLSNLLHVQEQLALTQTTLVKTEEQLNTEYEHIVRLTSEVETLTANLQATVAAQNKVEFELLGSQQECISISSKHDDLLKAYDELQEAASSLEAQVENSNRDISSLASLLTDLEVKHQALEIVHKDALCDLDTIQKREEKLIMERDELLGSVAKLISDSSHTQAELQDARANIESLSGDIRTKDEELASASAQLLEKEQAAADQNDELLKTHDLLESLEIQRSDALQRVSDLEDELLSKTTMLSDENTAMHHELKEKDRCIALLENTVQQLTESSNDATEIKEQLANYEAELERLRRESCAMAATLIASQSSAKDAQSKSELKEHELSNALSLINEQEEEICKLKGIPSHAAELAEAQEKLASLNEVLRVEREERALVMAKAMGEAESNTQQLRSRVSHLENEIRRLETKEASAHELTKMSAHRESALESQVEELQETKKREVEARIQLNGTVLALRNEIDRIKKSADSAQRSLESTYRSQLLKLKEEHQTMLRRLKARDDDFDHLSKMHSLTDEKLNNLKKLEAEHLKLQESFDALKSQLHAESERALKSETAMAEAAKLRHHLSELQQSAAEKDARITKLEANKLTTAQVEKIRKNKLENVQLKERMKAIEKELASTQQESSQLRDQLAHAAESTGDREQVHKLEFDRNAMGTRVRKLEADKRQLEHDLTQIRSLLRRFNIEDDDITKCIATLGDRIESLENSHSSSGVTANNIDQITCKVTALESQKVELERKLLRSESELKRTTAALQADIDKKNTSILQLKHSHMQATEELEQKNSRLTKENLDLFDRIEELQKVARSKQEEQYRLKYSDDTVAFEASIANLKNKSKRQLPPKSTPSIPHQLGSTSALTPGKSSTNIRAAAFDKENGSANSKYEFSLDNLSSSAATESASKRHKSSTRSPGPQKSPFGRAHGLGGGSYNY
ncbi:hypothetical protein MPSEU_000586500 [Mayamaea pseudoterrestris]|nr:hypothetical protein MPSEU_000586500 [Mayamaea pseudoterrestris]